jgi:hypothetical protein
MLVDADPEFVSIVGKGANRKVFRILKMDGVSADMKNGQVDINVTAPPVDADTEKQLTQTMVTDLRAKQSLIARLLKTLGFDAIAAEEDCCLMTTKGFGDGPGVGFTSFDSAVADVNVAPQIFESFGLFQRVMFNILNNEEIKDKKKKIGEEFDSLKKRVLNLVSELPKHAIAQTEEKVALSMKIAGLKSSDLDEVQREVLTDLLGEVPGGDEMDLAELKGLVEGLSTKVDEKLEGFNKRLDAIQQKSETDEEKVAREKAEAEKTKAEADLKAKADEEQKAKEAKEAEEAKVKADAQKAEADKKATEDKQELGKALETIATALKAIDAKVDEGFGNFDKRVGKIEQRVTARKGAETTTLEGRGEKKSNYADSASTPFAWDHIRRAGRENAA